MHHAFGSGGVENPDKPEVYSRPLVDGVGPEALVQTRVLTVTEIDWHHKRAGRRRHRLSSNTKMFQGVYGMDDVAFLALHGHLRDQFLTCPVYRIGTAARVRPCKHSRQRDTGDGLLMNGNAQVLESH